MAEIQVIPTYTTVAAAVTDVDVTTYYADGTYGEVYLAFINEEYGYYNGSSVLEGQLIAVGTENFLVSTDLEIDVDGNLLAIGDDAEKYSINANGELEYTT